MTALEPPVTLNGRQWSRSVYHQLASLVVEHLSQPEGCEREFIVGGRHG